MAASTKQPYPVEDFSGGMTDEIFGGSVKSAEVSQNFVITSDTKLQSRFGSVVDDLNHSPLPIGNSRIGRLVNYARNEKLFVQSAKDFFYRDLTGSYVQLKGPSGNSVLSLGSTANYVSTSEWNKQMFVVSDAFSSPMKIYRDEVGTYRVRNVGVPALATSPTVTAGQPGALTYLYGFIYSYTYKVNQQSFIELGKPTWVVVPNSGDPSAAANVISNIPALSNGTTNNYDTANVQVQIYRTTANGNTFYQIGTVQNGVTTFSDNVSDSNLTTNVQLYTNDGTLDYNPAPPSKYVHIVGNIGFYGYTNDSSGPHPYRVHQSVPGNPGFVPEITWVELEDEIKALSSVKNLPLAFCKKQVYRLDGSFQSSGAGGLTPVKIHNSAGCLSNESAVEAENYCFWAGQDGFYASDGYQVFKISDHLNQTYLKMVRSSKDLLRIQGRYDEVNRRVYWAVQTAASSSDNDTVFCLHLQFGIIVKSTFTTWNGASFKPSALEVFGQELYRGDAFGFVFRHDANTYTDPRIDVSKSVLAWAQETILWKLRSIQYNFGSSFFRKFVSRILLQAENVANTSIQITAINDQGKKTRLLKPIRWRRNASWGDEALAWGSPDCVWNSAGLIEQWRRFPARGLRLSYLQLEFTNAFGIVTTSDTDGECVLSRTLKTAALFNQTWPSQSVDYSLQFSNDNYTRTFPITAINGSKDTLTLLDPAGFLPVTGSYDWRLVGFEKGEPLSLINYTLHWDNVDQNQGTFQAGDSGGAA